MLKIEFHRIVQLLDVQSGLDRISMSTGMENASLFAWGCKDWNKGRLFLDKASASTLSVPLMWHASIWKSNFPTMKTKHLARCMASWFLEHPWLTMCTTAMLSHWTCTVFPFHVWPQIAVLQMLYLSLSASSGSYSNPDNTAPTTRCLT